MYYWLYQIPGYSRFDIFNEFDAANHVADGVRGVQYTFTGSQAPTVVYHGVEFDMPLSVTAAYNGVTLVECRTDIVGALPTFYEARYHCIDSIQQATGRLEVIGYLHCVLAAAQTVKFLNGCRWIGAPGRYYNPAFQWYNLPINRQENPTRQSVDYDLSGTGVVMYATGLFPDGAKPGDATTQNEENKGWYSPQGDLEIKDERSLEPWQTKGYFLTFDLYGSQGASVTNTATYLADHFPDFAKYISRIQLIPSTFLTIPADRPSYTRVIKEGVKSVGRWSIYYERDVQIRDVTYTPIPRANVTDEYHPQEIRVRVGYKDAFELDPLEYPTGLYLATRLYRGSQGWSLLLGATSSSAATYPATTGIPAAEVPLYELNLSGVAEPLQFDRDYLPSLLQAAAGTANTIAQVSVGNVVGALSSGASTVGAVGGLLNKSRQQLGGKATSFDAYAQSVNVTSYWPRRGYDSQIGWEATNRLSSTPNTDPPAPPTGGWWEGGNVRLLWANLQSNIAVPLAELAEQLSQEYAQNRVYCH